MELTKQEKKEMLKVKHIKTRVPVEDKQELSKCSCGRELKFGEGCVECDLDLLRSC